MTIQFAPGWDAQKVMDQIRKYNNGKKAANSIGGCEYLRSDGNRCFVGAFIPDEHTGLGHDGDARDLLATYPDLVEHMPFVVDEVCVTDPGVNTLLKLQATHDTCDRRDTSFASEGDTYAAAKAWFKSRGYDVV